MFSIYNLLCFYTNKRFAGRFHDLICRQTAAARFYTVYYITVLLNTLLN